MATVPQPDKLRMAEEFETPPQPPTAAESSAAPPPPQKFVSEFEEGGRKQRFEANSQEELIQKLTEAQRNATRKLQELDQQNRRRLEPEKQSSDYVEFRPSSLKVEELAQFQANPHEMFRRTFQAEIGMTPADFNQWINGKRRQEAEIDAQQQFVRKHSAEYAPTPDNANRIMNFLQAENLPVSKRNLDYAFDQLRAELAQKPSTEARPAVVEPGRPAQPVPTQVLPPPSFIRPSLGGPTMIDRSEGNNDAEAARIARSEPLSDLRARIEHMNRQLRSAR